MNKINITIIVFVLIAFGILAVANAENDEIKLQKGRNYITLKEGMYAEELVRLNKDIEYINYFDEFLNESIGYVNIFGGIGKNFFMEPDKTYEIGASNETTLIVYGLK